MPHRIQRKRTKGWKTPICSCGCGKPARYVGRPSKWGNPFVTGNEYLFKDPKDTTGVYIKYIDCPHAAVDFYEEFLLGEIDAIGGVPSHEDIRSELQGHDLACWCPLDQPCHADVLLEIANRKEDA